MKFSNIISCECYGQLHYISKIHGQFPNLLPEEGLRGPVFPKLGVRTLPPAMVSPVVMAPTVVVSSMVACIARMAELD